MTTRLLIICRPAGPYFAVQQINVYWVNQIWTLILIPFLKLQNILLVANFPPIYACFYWHSSPNRALNDIYVYENGRKQIIFINLERRNHYTTHHHSKWPMLQCCDLCNLILKCLGIILQLLLCCWSGLSVKQNCAAQLTLPY